VNCQLVLTCWVPGCRINAALVVPESVDDTVLENRSIEVVQHGAITQVMPDSMSVFLSICEVSVDRLVVVSVVSTSLDATSNGEEEAGSSGNCT
jgi:hypothetical protein